MEPIRIVTVSVMAQTPSASVWKQGMKFSVRLVLVHAGRKDLKRAFKAWERPKRMRTLLRITS